MRTITIRKYSQDKTTMLAEQQQMNVLSNLVQLYEELFEHDGYGEIRVEVRILKRGQKEVILHCGKQYRFVVDYPYQGAKIAPVLAGLI